MPEIGLIAYVREIGAATELGGEVCLENLDSIRLPDKETGHGGSEDFCLRVYDMHTFLRIYPAGT